MTERLSQLMRAEADALDIPAPPASDTFAQGRRLRRRKQIAAGVATVAAGAAVAVGAGVLVAGPDRQTDENVAVAYSPTTYQVEGALAVDRKLYVAGRHIPFDQAVKSFYYTSEGVVVRSGKSPWTDDGDVDHYTLVKPDGDRTSVDLESNDRMISTEPDSTNLAYATRNGDRWDVVVIDTATGDEVARRPVAGKFTWGGWEAPPVAIDGDLVWVHFDGGWTEVNWRTGDNHVVPGTANVHEIANGNYAVQGHSEWVVRRMSDGAEVARFAANRDTYAFFSPDGKWMKVFDQEAGMPGEKDSGSFLMDVINGERHAPPPGIGPHYGWGWTPRGDLLTIDPKSGEVRTCDPATAACSATGLSLDVSEKTIIKLGGNSYES